MTKINNLSNVSKSAGKFKINRNAKLKLNSNNTAYQQLETDKINNFNMKITPLSRKLN